MMDPCAEEDRSGFQVRRASVRGQCAFIAPINIWKKYSKVYKAELVSDPRSGTATEQASWSDRGKAHCIMIIRWCLDKPTDVFPYLG